MKLNEFSKKERIVTVLLTLWLITDSVIMLVISQGDWRGLVLALFFTGLLPTVIVIGLMWVTLASKISIFWIICTVIFLVYVIVLYPTIFWYVSAIICFVAGALPVTIIMGVKWIRSSSETKQ